jgi:hypothetical protein
MMTRRGNARTVKTTTGKTTTELLINSLALFSLPVSFSLSISSLSLSLSLSLSPSPCLFLSIYLLSLSLFSLSLCEDRRQSRPQKRPYKNIR